MEKRIALAIMFMFLLSPILAMTDDGGNVPVVSKKGTAKDTKQELNFSNTQVLNDINKADFPEKHIRDSILINKPIDKRMASILGRAGRFQTNAEDYLTVANVILEYEFSSVSSIKETLLASTGLEDKIKKSSTDKFDRFIRNLDRLSDSKNATIKVTSAGILKNFSDSNEIFVKIFAYFSQGADKDNWDLDGTSLFGYGESYKYYLKEGFSIEEIKECARNEIRVEAFRMLVKIDPNKAFEISDYILNKEVIKYNINERLSYDYHDLRAAIIRILSYKSKKDKGYNLDGKSSKYLTTNSSHIWSPDSSASYSLKYHGVIGTNSNEGYNPIYHDHTATAQDCANFGTQCLKHGGIDFSNASSGYICTANSNTDGNICSCDSLNGYLESRDDFKTLSIYFPVGTSYATIDASVPSWFRNGDIAIWGTFGGDKYKHTIIRSSIEGEYSKFSAHTRNRENEDLHYFFYDTWDNVTFYHVIGSTVLKSPSEDELTVQIGDTLDFQAVVTNNTEPTSLNPITNFKYILKKKPENTLVTLYDTSNPPSAIDSTYVFSFNTASQDTGSYVLYAKTTYTEGITQDSCFLKIKPIPEVIYPTPDDIILIKPPGKAIATDTLDIKIRVPEILGSYPNIKLKIDGVYVEQNDIVLEDSIYVYPWILNTVTSDPLGKRIKIEPELFDDPNCKTSSDILTVEAVFLETFQEVADLELEGWNVTEYAYPLYTCATNGWMIGPDPTYIKGEKCGRTYSTNSTSFIYQLYTPAFTVPDSSISKTKLEYKLYFKYNMIPYSYIYFDVCNESGTPLTSSQMLGPAYGLWTNMNYDLSDYSNQTIKLRWKHNYTDGMQNCYFTQYAIDNVAVYRIPDMDSPSIDFVHDNQAYVNENMIVRLEFNDDSDIQSVTADYEIEGDSDTITLLPSKDTYFYSGTIPARNHVCYGSIVFKIRDTIGNETVSEPYSISWIEPGGTVLTAPQNVAITAQTDSTFALTWDMVSGASGYKVYSSLDPYGVFSEDTTGTFTESRKWEKLFDGNKYFYYIIATDAAKDEVLEIIKPREVR